MTTQMKAILALAGVSLLSLSACVTAAPPSPPAQPVVVQPMQAPPQQPTVVVTPHAY